MIADIAVAIFLLSGILAGIRLVRGPSLADRVISLDAALVALMGAIGIRVAETGDTIYIGVLVVIAIVAFTATVALSRFIEMSGRPHAAGKASPIAFLLVAIGAALEVGWRGAAELAIVATALLLTLPASTHLLFRATHRTDPSHHDVSQPARGCTG